ncbi:MAG: alpha-amylase family glycosyl hydrolase [Anaerolineae bacterium]
MYRKFFSGLMVLALLLGTLGASAPAASAPHVVQTATISIDGVVDALYGAPHASDPAGDGNGNPNMDLLDLYIAEDDNYYYLAFTINDDIVTTNWGKYAIYIDTTNDANGATSDAWGRNVVVDDPHKPEYGIYAWVDGSEFGSGNTQLVPWTGSGWDWGGVKSVFAAARAFNGTVSVIEYQVAKADLGNADQLWVEVWNTGGGGEDNAQDTINNPPDDWNATDWDTQAVLKCSTPYGAPTVDGFVDAIYGLPVASDPAGDGNGNANMDLLDLYVTDDAHNYYFAFTINDDIVTTDWGKYAIYIDTTNDANGATNDAWGRSVVVDDPHKPEYGIYAWVDGGVFGPGNTQLVPWTGSGWDWGAVRQVLAAARAFDGSTSTIEYQVPKAFLGDADHLWVEVWNTGGGGGDNAQDTINDPPDDWNATDWSTQAVLACSTEVVARNYPVEKPVASQDNSVWWDGLEHDSRSDLYRQPFGAVPTETPITLRFRTYANDVTGVRVRLWDTTMGQQTIAAMTKVATTPGASFDYDIWELQMSAPDYLTVLYYRFIVTDGTDTDYYEDDDLYDGGLGQPYDASPDRSWQIDVYAPDFTVPDWFKDAVVYQIFPDRFRNGVEANDPISGTFFYDEDPGVVTAPQWNWPVPDPRVAGPWEGSYSKLFYGGDLQGIIDKLDYLEDLGVNTLYLNPIFESPSNHKYDTTNYSVIDDNFGDLATFITLTQELQDRGMYLILDGVFNHTSSDSHYFDRYGRYDDVVGACESVDSPYRDWYYFRPATPAGTGPCDGDTTYEAWWGFDSLPKLNTTNVPAVRSYIYSDTNAIARYWLTQGADGWRLDVAGDVHASFWRDWRDVIRDAKETAITIAEEWGDASHFILGDQLDSTMNYRFRNAVIGVLRETDWQDTNSTIRALSLSQFDSVMHSIEEDYPPEAFYAMMNLVGSHDVNRVLIPLDQDGDPTDEDYSDGKMRQKMLVLIQMTMPGAPTIYYGDEVALAGFGEATPSNEGGVYYSDPYNRQPYPWPDEDGYGDLPTWRQGDLDMLAHYSATAAIRNTYPALRTGSFDTLLVDDDAGIYAYGRGQGAVIGLNFGTTQTLTIPVDGYLPDGTQLMDTLNGGNYTVANGEIVVNDVPPMWGAVLVLSEQPTPPPPAPTNLAAVEGDGEAILTWDAVTGADSYNVYRSYVYGGGYAYLGQTTTPDYTDTTVTNGTLYYYVVTAVGVLGAESDVSNEVSALPHYTIDWANLQWPLEFTHTVGITPTQSIYGQVYIEGVTSEPGATTGLLAQIGFGAMATEYVTWTTWVDATYNGDVGSNDEFAAQLLPEEPGDFYYLYRYSTTGGRDWVYGDQAGTVLLPPLPGEMHVLPAADTTPPPVPLNLSVVHWGTDHVTVQWDPVSADDLAGYDLYRYAEGEAQASFLARVMEPTTIYTDTDVVVNTTYTYTVQAFDMALNKSDFSNPASGTAEAREVEVRFRVTIPPFTPPDDTIYIAGDNATYLGASWNPSAMPITRLDATTWAYTVTIPEETALQYKFTRGSWDVVENWGELVGEANRHLTVAYGSDGVMLVEDIVYNWRDPLVVDHYPAAGATTWDTAEPIWALISRPIDPARVTDVTFVVEQGGDGVVSGTLGVQTTTFDPYPDTAVLPYITGTLVMFTPTTALSLDQNYAVTLVASGYHDDVDMRANYVWTFGQQTLYIYLPLIMRTYTP